MKDNEIFVILALSRQTSAGDNITVHKQWVCTILITFVCFSHLILFSLVYTAVLPAWISFPEVHGAVEGDSALNKSYGKWLIKTKSFSNSKSQWCYDYCKYYVLLLLLLTFICHWKRKQLKCMCTA